MSQLPDGICNKCSKPAALMCQRCLENYCSVDCQMRDWREHKSTCYQIPRLIPIKGTNSPSASFQQSERTPSQMRRPNSRPNDSRRNPLDITPRSFARNPLPPANSHMSNSVMTRSDEDFVLKPCVVAKIAAWKNHFMPPKEGFFDVIVQFVDEINRNLVWVTEVKNNNSLNKLLSDVNRNICKDTPCISSEIGLGVLVAAPLANVLYRAEVIDINLELEQAGVRLIDYGNELQVPFSKLYPSTPIMDNLSAYAFRVSFAKECGPLELESVITIRLLGDSTAEGYYMAEIKSKSLPLHLPVELLKVSPEIVLKKILPGGRNALFRLGAGTQKLSDIDDYLNTEHGLKFDFDSSPAEGDFIAARTGRGWRRAYLLGDLPGGRLHKFLVYLLDEGSIEFCQQAKMIPDAFATQPMHILCISTDSHEEAFVESQLEAAAAKKLSLQLFPTEAQSNKQSKSTNGALYAGEHKLHDVLVSTFIGNFCELPGIKYWTESLVDGSQVVVTHIDSHFQVCISSTATKVYWNIFRALAAKCGCFKADQSISKGDIVMAMANVDAADVFFRGEITNVPTDSSGSFQVRNIDTGTSCDVSRSLLRIPNHFLRSMPVYMHRVKLVYLENIPSPLPDSKALATLEEIQATAVEFNLKFEANKSDTVDLYGTTDGRSLSKSLLPLLFEKRLGALPSTSKPNITTPTYEQSKAENVPMPPTPPNTPIVAQAPVSLPAAASSTATDRHSVIPNLNVDELMAAAAGVTYMLDQLEVIPIPTDTDVQVFVLDTSQLGEGYITAADLGNMRTMSECLTRLNKYCKCPHVKKGYAPKVNEICLAIYAEDGEWYRAVCLQRTPDGTYLVMFLDYGNICQVSEQEIMSITKDLMFPANANLCYIEALTAAQYGAFIKATNANPVIKCRAVKQGEEMYLLKVHDLEKMLS